MLLHRPLKAIVLFVIGLVFGALFVGRRRLEAPPYAPSHPPADPIEEPPPL